MKKKSILLLLTISLLMNGIYTKTITAAEVPPSMKTAYEEIASQRALWGAVPVTGFDIDVWNEYDVLVMDIPGTFPTNLLSLKEPDGSPNDYNSDADEYRYIGYNPDGYLVNNPKYPDDHSGSAVINNYDWQKNADPVTDIDQYISSPEDQTFYENEIFYVLEKEYGHRFDNTEDPSRWLANAIVTVPVSTTGDGVIKYMHKWDSNHDGVVEDWYITVNLRAKDEVIPEEGTTTVTSTTTGTSGTATLGNTRIAADARGSESFDVTKGIPTSEDLYANVIASEYIHSENYRNVTGTITYKVTVNKTYTLYKWDPQDKHVDTDGDGISDTWEGGWDSKTETVSNTYDVKRNYSFHMIDSISVYTLSSAIVNNAALPGGTLTLNSSVVAPTVSLQRDTVVENHYQTPIAGTTHTVTLAGEDVGKSTSNTSYDSVPSEDFTLAAEASIGKIRVKNDQLIFNGTTLMDDGWYDETAPIPLAIPNAPLNNTNDLYKADLTISNTVSNGTKASTGTLRYNVVVNTGSETTYTMPISGLNNVVVHTPVVCYPTLTEDPTYIQAIDKDVSVKNLVLDRTFSVHYPNSGTHITALGYGNRDYEKYIGQKQIKFNYDTYYGTSRTGTFIPANTWYTLDKTLDDYTFFIPHWVDEGSGEILFRVISNNDIGDANAYEFNANKDLTHYRAVASINVDLIGQIYDFQILSTTDPMFGEFFFTNRVRDNSVYVGPKDKYGNVQSLHDDIFPLMPGSNTVTGYQNKVVKKGHSIFFSIKSVGNMSDKDDFMTLDPKFYYVDLSGNNRQEVDIWHKVNGSYVKMDTNAKELKMSLSNLYTGISTTELTNTATAMYSLYGSSLSLADYKEQFIWQEARTSNKVGDTGLIALDWQQRTFIGETNNLPAGVSSLDALTGRQQFYGMYMIPSSAIFVPKGTSSTNVMTNTLSNGYIIVKFEVGSIDSFSGNPTDIHLSYDGAEANMYSVEGYNTLQNGFNLMPGDAAFYYTDQSADSDYNSITTH